MKLNIKVGTKILTATMDANPTMRDFISMLPLKMTLKDYASTEKVSDLPKKLSTQSAPDGSKPKTGHISYYAPWGNLAIFYKDFEYSKGLIKLGQLDGSIEDLKIDKPFEVIFELQK